MLKLVGRQICNHASRQYIGLEDMHCTEPIMLLI